MKKLIRNILCAATLTYSICSFAIPNPAAVNCVNNGYGYTLIQNTGICLFPDNTYCEEWAFFRDLCSIGENKFPGGMFDATKKYCVAQEGDKTIVFICEN